MRKSIFLICLLLVGCSDGAKKPVDPMAQKLPVKKHYQNNDFLIGHEWRLCSVQVYDNENQTGVAHTNFNICDTIIEFKTDGGFVCNGKLVGEWMFEGDGLRLEGDEESIPALNNNYRVTRMTAYSMNLTKYTFFRDSDDIDLEVRYNFVDKTLLDSLNSGDNTIDF